MQISISSKSRYGMRFVLSLRQSCNQRKRGLLFFRKAILSPLPRSAVEGTWTPTQVHGHEPESCAYANSATTAYLLMIAHQCGRQDLNLHGLPPEPKSGASANSATPAIGSFSLFRSLSLADCSFNIPCSPRFVNSFLYFIFSLPWEIVTVHATLKQ